MACKSDLTLFIAGNRPNNVSLNEMVWMSYSVKPNKYLVGTYHGVNSGVPMFKIKVNNMKISLLQLDLDISPEVAQEFIDYRAGKGKRYALNTQGMFDRQMKIALRAHEVGMTPDELIRFTMDQCWQGINISYTKNRINQMMKAENSLSHTATKNSSIRQNLTDTSWSN